MRSDERLFEDREVQAFRSRTIKGYWYWLLEPVGLELVIGLAFAMVGFAPDEVFSPRLRER
jgi:ABC-type dipeptide/oligopeptide/nickel transport system permease subunit